MWEFLKDQYDNFNSSIFDSSLTINATIYISGTPLSDVMSENYGDNLDTRDEDPIYFDYPEDLELFYRVNVYPLEKSSLSLRNGVEIQYGLGVKYEPYDRWISCQYEDIRLGNNKTLLDYSDRIQIEEEDYVIKGVVKESFGNKPVYHVFLVKET